MKIVYSLIVFAMTICLSYAQTRPGSRNIRFNTIGKDSINLYFDEEYNLIEDSCASIKRFAHFDILKRRFTGHFKDVSKALPALVLSEGTYGPDGLLNGPFTSRYLNGNPRWQGSFKDGRFEGKWEFFYEDGRPWFLFIASDSELKIMEVWDLKGEKIVDQGNGKLNHTNGEVIFSGKLVNGKPEGKWVTTLVSNRAASLVVTEHFKDGMFIRGNGPIGSYTDKSRMKIISEEDLEFRNAERMMVSLRTCFGQVQKKTVGAQYKGGFDAFNQRIKDVVTPFLSTVDLKSYDDEITFEGKIDKYGRIGHLMFKEAFDQKIASSLQRKLSSLPSMEPALIDGVPATQKIIIKFNFSRGMYRFNYRLLDITAN